MSWKSIKGSQHLQKSFEIFQNFFTFSSNSANFHGCEIRKSSAGESTENMFRNVKIKFTTEILARTGIERIPKYHHYRLFCCSTEEACTHPAGYSPPPQLGKSGYHYTFPQWQVESSEHSTDSLCWCAPKNKLSNSSINKLAKPTETQQ